MIVVLDTNVLVSGLLFGGVPARIVDAALAGRFLLATSRAQLDELTRVLGYKKLAKYVDDPAAVVDLVGQVAEVVEPVVQLQLSRDPDDDAILAIAVTASANILVTGDDDLLVLGDVEGVAIVRPAEALPRIDAAQP